VNVLVIAGPIAIVSLHGTDFEVIRTSPDHRQIASREKCYELVSFRCHEQQDSETLSTSIPQAIDKCWIRNDLWQPDEHELRAVESLRDEHDDQPLPLESELPIPAESKGLPIEPEASERTIFSRIQTPKELKPQDVSANFCHSFSVRESCRQILEEELGTVRDDGFFCYRRTSPGVMAFRATFATGRILFFKNLREREMPVISFPATPLPATPLPHYFTSLKDAAKYAAVDVRTIKNWKKDGYLKVEQTGRKIRIASTELDKCKRKQ
jgi:hypothetical protein